jgi:hypothetical protein
MNTWTRGHRIILGTMLFAVAIEGLTLALSPLVFLCAAPLSMLGLLLCLDGLFE